MITLLTGENSFELQRALDAIDASFDGTTEKYYGEDLSFDQLPDLLAGGTLFSDKRLIVIRNLSENRQLWDALPQWISRVNEDVHLIIVEPKPDKRTRSYKDLVKAANVQQFSIWGDRDGALAESWVRDEAERQGVKLDKKCIQLIVSRVGLDQWRLYHAIEKLSALDTISPEVVENVIEAQPAENIFYLFENALRGDSEKVHGMLQSLRHTQDPYMTFGLLSGQVFQLAALCVADVPPAVVAADVGAHPYAMSKLVPYAKKMNKHQIKKIVEEFAYTDSVLKSSPVDPWILIEKSLIKTASL